MREHALVSASCTTVERLDESWNPQLFSVSTIIEFLASFTMVFKSASLIEGAADVSTAVGRRAVATGVGSESDTNDSLGGLTGGRGYRRVVVFSIPEVSSL